MSGRRPRLPEIDFARHRGPWYPLPPQQAGEVDVARSLIVNIPLACLRTSSEIGASPGAGDDSLIGRLVRPAGHALSDEVGIEIQD